MYLLVCGSLFAAYSLMLFGVRRCLLLFVVCCVLDIGCCFLAVGYVCWMLRVVCCVLFVMVVNWLLVVVRCLCLFVGVCVVCCLSCGV